MEITALPLTPDPAEHAVVLIEVAQGDLTEAWSLALSNRQNDKPNAGYWQAVAEAIAKVRPVLVDPSYYRPQSNHRAKDDYIEIKTTS